MITAPTIAQSAVRAAEAGWHIMPLHGSKDGRCTCGNADCASPAKHPIAALVPRGLHDASADPVVVAEWWRRCPLANIGIPTGVRNGLVVVDEDGDEGKASMKAMENARGPIDDTLRVRTGRGWHRYFRHIDGDVKNSAGRLGKGIDVRGEGGYVVAPPSVHITGYVYAWHRPIRPIAPLPEWLRLLALPPAEPAPRHRSVATDANAILLKRARAYIAAIPVPEKGRRNDVIFSAAGHLGAIVGEGGECLGDANILAILTGFNMLISPPLSDEELRKTVASGLKNGEARDAKPPRAMNHRQLAMRGREVTYAR